MQSHATATSARRERGAGMIEFIVVTSLVAVGVMGLVKAFGHRIAERFAVTSASLDRGTALKRVPVTVQDYKEGWRTPVHGKPESDLSLGSSIDPSTDTDGPQYAEGKAHPGKREEQYIGHSLANLSGAWKPGDLLGAYTQFDAPYVPGHRCAPTCAVAAALMAGPEAFDRLVGQLRRSLILGTMPENPANQPGYDRAAAEDILASILKRSENHQLTREDIGIVTEILAHYSQPDPADGASHEAAARMMNLGSAGERTTAARPRDGREFQQWITDELKPGDVVRSSVDADGDQDWLLKSQHAVLVGKDMAGREYIYDPYPKPTQRGQLVYRDEDPGQFAYYLDKMIPYHSTSEGSHDAIGGGKVYHY